MMENSAGVAECEHACVEQIISVGFDEFADIFGEVIFVEVFNNGESHGAAVADPEV